MPDRLQLYLGDVKAKIAVAGGALKDQRRGRSAGGGGAGGRHDVQSDTNNVERVKIQVFLVVRLFQAVRNKAVLRGVNHSSSGGEAFSKMVGCGS